MPGSTLPFDDVVETIADDINEALGSPESFAMALVAGMRRIHYDLPFPKTANVIEALSLSVGGVAFV